MVTSKAEAGRSPVLVDSNVILDVTTHDTKWADWSSATLTALADESLLVINPIVYAEVSVDFARIEDLDGALPRDLFLREPLPYEAGFLAAKCHQAYRRRGGLRLSVLPDFYLGAHAAVRGYRLLSRDGTRFRTYFPTVPLISPA
ncbi:MAG TPA: type II toxin-antitoxin system VapC family toxin [Streptosporangiaceae bacterium]|nr:type II toxin-antitoxin system VapC family toxin [Streptosporangiaceae bacterium]